MIRLLLILITGVFVSFFYFPVEFVFLPGINTKMMEAVLGLACLAFVLVRRRSLSVSRDFLILVITSAVVSVISLLSITINGTPDNAYVTYIVSFSVWLSAAFAVSCLIRAVHGKIEIQLVLNYLITVCVVQCILALIIDASPVFANRIDSYFQCDQELARKVSRLYGIGALFDVAGIRFSLVLVATAFYLSEMTKPLGSMEMVFYFIGFLVLSVIGNMIARTTMVGTAVGLIILLISFFVKSDNPSISKLSRIWAWLGLLALTVVICIVLYNTNFKARELLRFAFEGFFSLVEKGYWEISSTEKLKTMVVWPETLHTWIIGDGYFANSKYDINYLGDATDKGFYMGTDVGYLRFIFYFGVIGLIPMMWVIIWSGIICMRNFKKERFLFLLEILVGLIVWLKVSTDVFLFFAIFLSVAALQASEETAHSCMSSTI